MIIQRGFRNILVCSALLLLATQVLHADETEFRRHLEAMQTAGIDADASLVESLLRTGIQAQRPAEAYAACRGWLQSNGVDTKERMALVAEAATLAGDYPAAVAYWKLYVESKPGAAETDHAAGRMYDILVQYMDDRDGAFTYMRDHGEALRTGIRAKRYDVWFLSQALERGAIPAAARRLAVVYGDGMPLEMERQLYGAHLDGVLEEATRKGFEVAAAGVSLVELAGRIRDDRVRAARTRFVGEALRYLHAVDGSGEGANPDAMIQAARQYIEADPSVRSVQDVYALYLGGRDHVREAEAFDFHRERKQRVLFDTWDKLPSAVRLELMNGRHRGRDMVRLLAGARQWGALVRKEPAFFNQPGIPPSLPLFVRGQPDSYSKELAPHLKDCPAEDAAVVRAMAAGGDFPNRVKHFLTTEAWRVNPSRVRGILRGEMWETYKAHNKGADDAEFRRALIQDGGLAQVPALVWDRDLARDYIDAAWAESGPAKERLPALLTAVEWAPWDHQVRNHALQPLERGFRDWSNWVNRHKDSADQGVTPEMVAALPRIRALVEGFPDRLGNADKAPNDVCRHYARMVLARRADDQDTRTNAGMDLLKLVQGRKNRRPFAQWGMEHLIRGDRAQDRIDLQAAAFTAILSEVDPAGRNDDVLRFNDLLCSTQWNANWDSSRDRNIRTFEPVMREALRQQARRDKRVWMPLFSWWRNAARHHNREGANELLPVLLADDALYRSYRAATSPEDSFARHLSWMLAHVFPDARHHLPDGFRLVDLAVREINETGSVNPDLWRDIDDTDNRMLHAAAALFARHTTLPFGYGDGAVALYDANRYGQVMNRILASAGEAEAAGVLRTAAEAFGKTRFDEFAINAPLLALHIDVRTSGGRSAYADALRESLSRARSVPGFTPLAGTAEARNVARQLLNDTEIQLLTDILMETGDSRGAPGSYLDAARILFPNLVREGTSLDLHRLAPVFFLLASRQNDRGFAADLAQQATVYMQEGHLSLAMALSAAGLRAGFRLPDEVRAQLAAIETSTQVGTGRIPVPPTDPQYPLYASQQDYATGRIETAWQMYLENTEVLPGMMRDLSPQYSLWIIRQNIHAANLDEAERLTRIMLTWISETPDGFTLEDRGTLQILYSDIAFERGEFPVARARYAALASDSTFADTRIQAQAQLRVADVDRVTRQYEAAETALRRLARSRDPVIRGEAHFLGARVRFDQEDYDGAREQLETLFATIPDHAEGRILEGRIQLGQRRLMEATQIRLGIREDQRILVPGQPLRIHLEDRNLSVAGRASLLEIRVWTKSGDEEHVTLRPFGDSRTTYHGSIDTELGTARPGDGTLQILGGAEEVYYSFSERFAREHHIEVEVVGPLGVASDATLLVSSGAILSAEERERQRMEDRIRRDLRLEREEGDDDAMPLGERRPHNQVKPGNPIHVRVIDPDQSASTTPDTIEVTVSATSGDRIAAFPLTETGPATGIFEGRIPTDRAPATAFAMDTTAGSDPNLVISEAGDAPWIARPDNRRPKWFTVDINDNIDLGTLDLRAADPTRRLKRFAVQTSVNGREFRTVAHYPDSLQPWDGTPQVELAAYNNALAYDLGGAPLHENYLAFGYTSEGLPKSTAPAPGMRFERDDDFNNAMRSPIRLDWRAQSILRMRGQFFQSAPATRRFRVEYPIPSDRRADFRQIEVFLNGESIRPQRDGTLAFERSLRPGLYTLEVVLLGEYRSFPSVTLLCDNPQTGAMEPAPVAMFDPSTFPEGVRPRGGWAVPVEAKGDDLFSVTFAPGSQARLLRLLLLDFEGDAPALHRLRLTDAAGSTVLPTKQDFRTLRENQILEIVPGDRITVEYVDPRHVTPNRGRHEAFLNATYYDATLSAASVEYRTDAQGNRRAFYHALRRFRVGDPVTVFIRDPDMDVSPERDEVEFQVRTTSGSPVTLRALETDNHSGVFLATLFPVAEPGSRPADIHVKPGEEILIRYRDEENQNPGVPFDRTYAIEQATYAPPLVAAYRVTSEELAEGERVLKKPEGAQRQPGEFIPIRRRLVAEVDRNAEAAGAVVEAFHGVPVRLEVIAPHLARSARSRIRIFAQTESARRAARGGGADDPAGSGDRTDSAQAASGTGFDLSVPGTLVFEVAPGTPGRIDTPPGYASVTTRPNPMLRGGRGLDAGQFPILIPHAVGPIPTRSYATLSPEELERIDVPDALSVQGEDLIHAAFAYEDETGTRHWVTRTFRLQADPQFDVMDRRFEALVDGAYVGESLYLRVIDPRLSGRGAEEAVQVTLTSESGGEQTVALSEAFAHTGIFTGIARILHAGEQTDGEDGTPTLEPGGIPVQYGDTITLRYMPRAGEPLTRDVRVHRGADGSVVPFTKRFDDPQMAIRTLFALAESHFELAKMHRRAGDEALSRRQMGQAKRILEEALLNYRDDEIRAQAEYLLGNLALEYGDIAEQEQIKQQLYEEALDRFTAIPGNHPESPFAARAQFKKALVYEKMGNMDIAAEEYVKLSYRYPDNEFVPETMGRLGQYFLRTGREMEQAAQGEADPVQAETVRVEARKNYVTAAEVFRRIRQRFPDHSLANRTQLLAGQSYIRAERFGDAIATLMVLVESRDTESELRAESMYWAGMANEQLRTADALRAAYTLYRQVTWDYPESRWARFARGRLADPDISRAGGD